MHTLETVGMILGLDDGLLAFISPYDDTILHQQRHPFGDKI